MAKEPHKISVHVAYGKMSKSNILMTSKQSYKAISVLFSRVESWHCHSVGQLVGPPLWSRLSCVRLTFWVFSESSVQLLGRLPWNLVTYIHATLRMNCNNFKTTFNITLVHCCALVKRHSVTVDSCWEKYVFHGSTLWMYSMLRRE